MTDLPEHLRVLLPAMWRLVIYPIDDAATWLCFEVRYKDEKARYKCNEAFSVLQRDAYPGGREEFEADVLKRLVKQLNALFG